MIRQALFLSIGILNVLVILSSCVTAEASHYTANVRYSQQVDYRGQDRDMSSSSEPQNVSVQCNQTVPFTVSGSSTGTFMYNNSIQVTSCNPMGMWEAIVSVVSQYFPINIENACRQINNHITPGNLTTGRTIGATIFEPWRKDSVGFRERWESTIHSISRRAEVHVWPTEQNTFTIQIIVYKDIENTQKIDIPSVTRGNYFLSDSRSTFRDNIIIDSDNSQWINRGRDSLLEQRILAEIKAKIN